MKFKVIDWAGNDMNLPLSYSYEDAWGVISETIDRVYGELNDHDFDIQLGEYQVIEVSNEK